MQRFSHSIRECHIEKRGERPAAAFEIPTERRILLYACAEYWRKRSTQKSRLQNSSRAEHFSTAGGVHRTEKNAPLFSLPRSAVMIIFFKGLSLAHNARAKGLRSAAGALNYFK